MCDICWQILLLTFFSQWGKLSITKSQNFYGFVYFTSLFSTYLSYSYFSHSLCDLLCSYILIFRNLWEILIICEDCLWQKPSRSVLGKIIVAKLFECSERFTKLFLEIFGKDLIESSFLLTLETCSFLTGNFKDLPRFYKHIFKDHKLISWGTSQKILIKTNEWNE